MRAIVACCFVLLACRPNSSSGDGGEQATDGGLLPTTVAEIQTFLRSGAYLGWASEPAAHPSQGPHGVAVRTFADPVLYESLKTGRDSHPVGSMVVKELRSATELTGYAVDVKRTDGEWVFFEGFLPSLDQYYFVGTANLCGNCHTDGKDFVLTAPSAFP